jgi:imidazole glycerol-phosphate synthase subunit HisH
VVSGVKGVSIGIVDVGIGNLGSLRHAVYSQGWDTVSVTTPDDLADLTHLLLPGVGAFASAMARLSETSMIDPIRHFAAQGRPVMGICLGMHILAEMGTEGGNTLGLALIPGKVVPIMPQSGLRLPHVGWNESRQLRAHPLLKGIRNDVDFYFVHSYRFVAVASDTVLTETEYGERFPSIIGKGNVVGIQFHPEKSQVNGLRLLDNFCLWDGAC